MFRSNLKWKWDFIPIVITHQQLFNRIFSIPCNIIHFILLSSFWLRFPLKIHSKFLYQTEDLDSKIIKIKTWICFILKSSFEPVELLTHKIFNQSFIFIVFWNKLSKNHCSFWWGHNNSQNQMDKIRLGIEQFKYGCIYLFLILKK